MTPLVLPCGVCHSTARRRWSRPHGGNGAWICDRCDTADTRPAPRFDNRRPPQEP